MQESDRVSTYTIIHIGKSIFCHDLQLHLMRKTLSFSPLKASHRASRPEILPKKLFHNFYQKKGVDFLLLKDAASEIEYSCKNKNEMINNSIIVSKLHMVRKKKDFSCKWYTLHVLRFWQFLRFQILVGFLFF